MQNTVCQYCNTKDCFADSDVWLCRKCGARVVPNPKLTAQIVNFIFSVTQKQSDYILYVLDFSKWQRPVNFLTLKNSDAIYCIIKASQGINPDYSYADYITGLLENEIPFGLYHFGDPYYNAASSATLFADQVNSLTAGWEKLDAFSLISPYGGRFIAVFDVEDHLGYNNTELTPYQMYEYINTFITVFESKTRIKLSIYTRKSWWDVHVIRSNKFYNRLLWTAHYNQNILEPAIPVDWSNYGATWLLWQVDDKGLGNDGSKWGFSSHGADVSYIKFTSMEEAKAWIYPKTPPDTGEEIIMKYRILRDVYLRTEPNTGSSVVRMVHYGEPDLVGTGKTAGKGIESWVEVLDPITKQPVWVAWIYKVSNYLEYVRPNGTIQK